MTWDGKERRKSGNAEELRHRIEQLQRDWERAQRGDNDRGAGDDDTALATGPRSKRRGKAPYRTP